MSKIEWDFDLKALYEAIDQQRVSRGLSWSAATPAINHFQMGGRPIAVSTITGLKSKPVGEGDCILQMLLCLDRTPDALLEMI